MPEINRSLCYVSCTEGGFEVLRNLLKEEIVVDQIVTLTPEQGTRNEVSGYYSFEELANNHNIPLYSPVVYEMTADADVEFFEEQSFDVMIVNGWQRLIREPVLDTVSIGAFGVHGSASGLPKGRGRSPMNWSLIEDLNRFLLSIIRLDEDVDSGAIVDTRKFDVTDFDTIRTMYYKLAMATSSMLIANLNSIFDETIEYDQQLGTPTFYPKRTPGDGAIHWHNSTKDIYNLVRAVGKPYPGSFTEHEDNRVYIWKAKPFSTDFGLNAEEGEIIQIFRTTGEFVVRTGDGTLLVQEWKGEDFTPQEGMVFTSIGGDGREDEEVKG